LVQPEQPPIFEDREDDYLLSLGVPENWLPTLHEVRDDDQLLLICEKLPSDVAERLLNLAAGELVTPPVPVPPERPVIEAADTRRRFYLVEDAEGLAAALEAPMERWIAFLHPSQRALVERAFSGPAKVSGSAGTGKTVVAMHRARNRARQGVKVLLTSYVTTLCENIERNLRMLCSPSELEDITVSTVHKQALAIVTQVEPKVRPAPDDDVRRLLDQLRVRHAPAYEKNFVQAEWENVVRLQGLSSWDEYRGAQRTGRGSGLAVKERKVLWQVFGGVLESLASRRLLDWTGLCLRAQELLTEGRAASPYGAVIVDEVQDLKPAELRFVNALCSQNPGNLMLCGDAGQRIYPGGYSLSAMGIEVRGRSTVLRINYRTTEQIRRLADRMLGDVADDLDGGEERRSSTRSLLRGPTPQLLGYASQADELTAGVAEVGRLLASGLAPKAIGIFARTNKRIDEMSEALSDAGIACRLLSEHDADSDGAVQLGTMHRAKGLEFKAVLVIGCADNAVPSAGILRKTADPQDREAVEARECRLLYVAMTRARDELKVSWAGAPSRFLAPLLTEQAGDTK
jgi:superfamily I DNA/RNA helicase